MREFVEEYGRIIVAAMCTTFLVFGIMPYFFTVWTKAGTVEDGPKTNFYKNEGKRLPPSIYCTDFKVLTGQPVCFTDYVSAADFDGKDITRQIQIVSEDGKKVEKIWSTPGIYRFSLWVKSSVTGKQTRGKLLVLVEAMPQGGELH